MHWLRFAAIWVYCLGTFVVPALHHGLHEHAHSGGGAQSDSPASCFAGDCGCHNENPFAAKRGEASRSAIRATDSQNSAANTLAADGNQVAGLESGAAAHHCSATCAICLAISVFGNAIASPIPISIEPAAASSHSLVDQSVASQTCLGDSVPRGPPAACCDILV